MRPTIVRTEERKNILRGTTISNFSYKLTVQSIVSTLCRRVVTATRGNRCSLILIVSRYVSRRMCGGSIEFFSTRVRRVTAGPVDDRSRFGFHVVGRRWRICTYIYIYVFIWTIEERNARAYDPRTSDTRLPVVRTPRRIDAMRLPMRDNPVVTGPHNYASARRPCARAAFYQHRSSRATVVSIARVALLCTAVGRESARGLFEIPIWRGSILTGGWQEPAFVCILPDLCTLCIRIYMHCILRRHHESFTIYIYIHTRIDTHPTGFFFSSPRFHAISLPASLARRRTAFPAPCGTRSRLPAHSLPFASRPTHCFGLAFWRLARTLRTVSFSRQSRFFPVLLQRQHDCPLPSSHSVTRSVFPGPARLLARTVCPRAHVADCCVLPSNGAFRFSPKRLSADILNS